MHSVPDCWCCGYPADPLNGAAAALMFKDPEAYKQRIHEHVKKHASVDFKLSQDDDEDDAAGGGKEEEDDDLAGDDDKVMSDPDDEILSDLDEAPEEDAIKAEA